MLSWAGKSIRFSFYCNRATRFFVRSGSDTTGGTPRVSEPPAIDKPRTCVEPQTGVCTAAETRHTETPTRKKDRVREENKNYWMKRPNPLSDTKRPR